MLYKAGLKDNYRTVYPNTVTHPVFTCNAGNKKAVVRELLWALGTDERKGSTKRTSTRTNVS